MRVFFCERPSLAEKNLKSLSPGPAPNPSLDPPEVFFMNPVELTNYIAWPAMIVTFEESCRLIFLSSGELPSKFENFWT
jgi:hypothetical protein